MDRLKEKILHYFEDGKGHGFDHTERVYNLAVRIAKEENADLDVVKASTLLHDICRKKEEETGLCHASEGSKLAPKILKELNFSEEKIKNVVHCIEVHRFSKGLKPLTKEARILQDADRLDAIGAIAITRIISHNTMIGNPVYDPTIKPSEEYTSKGKTALNHFFEKIFKLKPETFHTCLAKEIAKDRYKFTTDFVDRFISEWRGN
ncbi:HD domain-containing protein [archaeon]|jgi:uncharacterized protein|nr:HD domain-containing protein [archaeon]